jgi:hypothetical protein
VSAPPRGTPRYTAPELMGPRDDKGHLQVCVGVASLCVGVCMFVCMCMCMCMCMCVCVGFWVYLYVCVRASSGMLLRVSMCVVQGVWVHICLCILFVPLWLVNGAGGLSGPACYCTTCACVSAWVCACGPLCQ